MMSVYAIGDLHLSKASNKPMDIFGDGWKDHAERLFSAWAEVVRAGDIVLIPGDISWALSQDDARTDLSDMFSLPGEKVFIKGNHDYWWASLQKLNNLFSDRADFYFLQNRSIMLNDIVISGSRGWLNPGSPGFAEKDMVVYKRELLRLELSLKEGSCLCDSNQRRIAMIHYPPMLENTFDTGFTELFERYGISEVVYGHLHAKSCKSAFEGEHNGINYTLCSADHLGFCPKKIL